MISAEPLESKITSSPEREISETDPVLDKIITLAEQRQYVAAAERCEELWRQRVYDARTLGFYLFGLFVEQGLVAIERMLGAITATLTLNWSLIGPAASKQRHCDMALRWLFLNMLTQIRFFQSKPSDDWNKWLKQWDEPMRAGVLERIPRLVGALDEVMPTSQCKGPLLTLQNILQALPTVPVEALEADSMDGPENHAMPNENESNKSAAKEPRAEAPPARQPELSPSTTVPVSDAPSAATLTVPLSPAMQALLRKLAAFNQLVKMGKFRHAWIIYNDVKHSIEKFDPRVYLPSLFGEYFSNLVANAERLRQRPSNEDDFAVQALLELYHIDVDRFVAAKG